MDFRRVLAYAAIYFLWGGTYLAVRTVVLVTPPFSAAALRFLISGLLLLAISRMEHAPWPTRKDWQNCAKLGFVMFTINYACFFWAEQRLYSGVAAVVVATMPVWIMLAEWLLLRARRLSVGSVAGSLLGIAGVILATSAASGHTARNATGALTSHQATILAICVLLTGTISWSAGSVWSGTLQLPAQQSVRAALQMTTGGLFLGVLAGVVGEGRRLGPALRQWTTVTWMCFAYLIVASIVAFTAYVWLLHHEPTSRVASYAYVNPLVALALGVGLAHEHVSAWQGVGGALVLFGVFVTLRSRSAVAPAVARTPAAASET